jgi:competence protein ComEC
MVGAEASVVRATLMAFIALVALLFGRGYVAHQALLLSFLGIVLYSPASLLSDVSLHLSFLATAGIVYMSDGIKKYVESFSFPPVPLFFGYIEIVTTTLAAYFVTLPYVIYTFGTVSVYGLLANFLVLPLVSLIMLLTVIVVGLASLNVLLASLLGYTVTLFCGIVIFVARAVESLPYSSFPVSLSFTKVLVLYLFIIMLYRFFMIRIKNETRVTNENEITSGVISY